ncbi:MAG: hypothetical protein SH847_09825 [Roseiflexaceae bacterium]|nr:hypothetical protein [Roseiflexaceae bacterium]
MQTYRAIVRPHAATRSPWQADMLFGHLCWQIRYRDGEAALHTFLQHYHQNTPPVLFSDGFPGDWLPRPLLPRPAAPIEASKPVRIVAFQQAKREKSVRWISRAEFERMRNGELVTFGERAAIQQGRSELKNQINRLTGGTTPPEDLPNGSGNLYNVEELAYRQEQQPIDISVYVRVRDEQWAHFAQAFLAELARGGYGAKKSVGYGQFSLIGWETCPELDRVPERAVGFISLNNWVPAASDPTDGRYSTLVKYGKVGEEFTNSGNPFKYPLIMLAAGSSFATDGAPLPWYGRVVQNISVVNADIVHYGFALAIASTWDASNEIDQ